MFQLTVRDEWLGKWQEDNRSQVHKRLTVPKANPRLVQQTPKSCSHHVVKQQGDDGQCASQFTWHAHHCSTWLPTALSKHAYIYRRLVEIRNTVAQGSSASTVYQTFAKTCTIYPWPDLGRQDYLPARQRRNGLFSSLRGRKQPKIESNTRWHLLSKCLGLRTVRA